MGLQVLFAGHAGESRSEVDESAGHEVHHDHVPRILSADIAPHQRRQMIVSGFAVSCSVRVSLDLLTELEDASLFLGSSR